MGKYIVTHLGPVNHDGRDYSEGEAIDLDDKAAAAAVASGSLAKPKAKAKPEADPASKPNEGGQPPLIPPA